MILETSHRPMNLYNNYIDVNEYYHDDEKYSTTTIACFVCLFVLFCFVLFCFCFCFCFCFWFCFV